MIEKELERKNMSTKAARAYANNEVDSRVHDSSSGELIVLVYERILDHLKFGKLALQSGEYGIEAFTKANDLIQQGLLACIDLEAGEIAMNLGAIYEWALRQIIIGRADKAPEKIQEVIDVLTPLYQAWLSLSPKEMLHSSNSESYWKSSVVPTRLNVVNI